MRITEAQAPAVQAAHGAPVRPAAITGTPAAPAQARVDRAELNPFADLGVGAASVTVDGWRKGPNDSLERIRRSQGYSLDEIYRKGADGQRLLERVAQANGLRDPNMMRAKSKLRVPSKLVAKPEGQAAPAPAAPKPAAPKPAAAKPAAPKPAAPQTAAPQVQAPQIQAPQVQVPQVQAPQVEAPPVQPAPVQPAPPAVTSPAAPNENGAATVEIGLLLDGVNQKKINRGEFQALNSAANQYTEMRARYGKEGYSNDELATLGKVEKQYGQLYTRFMEHDRSRIRFTGTDSQDPATRQRVQQNDNAGSTFDDYNASRINGEALITRLMEQREAARRLGEQ